MTTPSTKPGPTGASSANGSARDWGTLRSGEPGSAFRGLTKGRANRSGGRGGGRGDRGGRGRNFTSRGGQGSSDSANGAKSETTFAKVDTPTSAKSTPAAEPSTPSTEKAQTLAANKTSKPKANPRWASRNVPTLVLPPSTPTVETLPASAPSRPSSRRRRPQQHGKSPVTASSPMQSLSVEPTPSPNLLLPQKARTGPSSPIAPPRDAPPHLSVGPDVSTFNMKHNIDALVERVRAVAMDNNRPTTPGSHIDWAGDDDDSLPDLDDWGVTTSTSVVGEQENKIDISPILVDGLKPLPEPSTQLDDSQEDNKVVREVVAPTPVDIVTKATDKAPRRDRWKSKRTTPLPLPLQHNHNKEVVPKLINSAAILSSDSKTTLSSTSTPDTTASQAFVHSVPTTKTSESPSKSLHPSLPAKPVAAVETLAAQTRPRPAAMPMRVAAFVKQPVAVERSSDTIEPLVATVEETSMSLAQPSTTVKNQTFFVATARTPSQAVAALHTSASSPEDNLSTEDTSDKDKPGLAASMHASVSLPESASLPDLALSIPTAPCAFNPTHHRAHTVDRAQASNHADTAPDFQQRFSRSGAPTPGGYGLHAYHGRTHSSPPTGAALNPRVHTQRPIITVDAISRLAKTIGGIPPPRMKEVSIAKE